MNYKSASEVLNSEWPIQVRNQIVPVVNRAYKLTSILFQETEWLDWQVGINIKGYLKNIAVEHELMKLVDRWESNYSYDIEKNEVENYSYLKINTNYSSTTISQTKSIGAIPRKANFRSNYSISNQLSIEFEEDIIVPSEKYYFIITHGGETDIPEFINIGLPEPYTRGWIVRNNLLSEPYYYEISQEEKIDKQDLVSLKDHINNVKKNEE